MNPPNLHPFAIPIYGLASLKHFNQTRRDGETPYMEHIHDILRLSKTEDALKQAIIIGHDLFEDTDVTVEEIEKATPSFSYHDGMVIVGCLKELTKRPEEDYSAFIDRLMKSPFWGILGEIKLWDIAANLADHPTPKQIEKYGRALVQMGWRFEKTS